MTLQSNKQLSRLEKYSPFLNSDTLNLDKWGVFNPELNFISDTENIIIRADSSEHSYCVRIYPDQSRATPEIYAELFWLLDLRKHTNLIVPHPLQTSSGQFIRDVFIPELETSFRIVLFHWLPGEIVGSNLNIDTANYLGQAMANLHTHSTSFTLPSGSFRDRDDWRGMGAFLARLAPSEILHIESFLTPKEILLCDRAAQLAAVTINQIDDPLNFGLIHSDLHSNNCLSIDGQIGIIDFDDCQFAPFTCDMAIAISSFDGFPDSDLLQSAFIRGYAENRTVPLNYVEEIVAFRLEWRLRLIRWVSTWPHINHFSFGPDIIENSLNYIKQQLRLNKACN